MLPKLMKRNVLIYSYSVKIDPPSCDRCKKERSSKNKAIDELFLFVIQNNLF